MYRLAAWFGVAACSLLAIPASAQVFPFSLRLQQGTTVTTINNGGTISLPATGLGKGVSATVTATFQGTGTVNISAAPSLTQAGSDFSASLIPAAPVTLNPGDSVTIAVTFSASVTTVESALLTVPFTQGNTTGSIQLTVVGASAVITTSYTLPTNQNAVPLPPGGTIQFPPTQVNTSIIATVLIANTGAGTGTVNAISIPPGSAFQLFGVGTLPATLNAGGSFPFGVKYNPTAATNDQGSLAITVNGTIVNYSLAGSGITSSYSYSIASDTGGADTPITPNQTTTPVSFPDTALGMTSSFFIKVRNVGGAVGSIPLISATGVFSVTDGPPMFPVVMNPNDQITFTLTFAPTVPGKITGRLTVGSDVFSLVGTGLGPKLTFTYGPGNVVVAPTGTVVFSPVQVGQNSQQSFTVTNAGTSAITIASIAVADTKGVFKIVNPPPLPATLNPNDSLTFQMTFEPAVTGFSTTSLQIDTNSFTLSGSGTPPPGLPSFQFTGASGNVTPLQQPLVGLSLAAPYPLPLTGTLTIAVNSGALVPDPTVQFATGKQTVTFTIPANTTDAVFPTGATQIGLQAGTTAGTITITPTFATQSGLDMTPIVPPTLSLVVPAAAPQLFRIQITNVSQAGFVVSLAGLATTHSLQTLNITFTPTGSNPKTSSYPIDVSSQAGLWYTSAGSLLFGGQFSVAVPFSIPSPSATALSTSHLKSVSATATNAQGTSTPITFTIQ